MSDNAKDTDTQQCNNMTSLDIPRVFAHFILLSDVLMRESYHTMIKDDIREKLYETYSYLKLVVSYINKLFLTRM